MKANEACTVWAVAQPSGAARPSGDQVVSQGTELSGVQANAERSIVLAGLSPTTDYDVYLIAEDGSGNRQADAFLVAVTTAESVPPVWAEGYPRLDQVQATTASILVMADEACTVWALALADGSAVPSASSILNQGTFTTGVPADTEFTIAVSGLAGATAYDLYLLAEDAHGNIQEAPVKLDFVTVNALAPAWEPGGLPAAGGLLPTGAAIVFTAGEDCTVYYLVLADGTAAPSAETVVGTGIAVAGIIAGEERSISISGLEDSTSYDVYLVAVDVEGNTQSSPTLVEFTTTDGTPPTWSATYPKMYTIGFTNATVLLKTNESCTAYILLLEDGTPAPSASEVRFDGRAISVACAANGETSRTLSNLSLDTAYDLYLVAQDAIGNLQASPVLVEFRTFADVSAPAWQPGYPRLDTTSATGTDIFVWPDENCTVYALVLPDGNPAPTSAQVTSSPSASKFVYGGGQTILSITGLYPVTSYDIWVVARDPSGNLQSSPVKIDATTITVQVDVVLIPEGTNVSIGWDGVYWATPVHTVPAISSFRMARYETTYDLWVQVRNWALTHGYTFQNTGTNKGASGDCPVVGVSWSDVFAWCNAFSEYNGYSPAYYTSPGKTTVYRDATNSTCDLVAVGTALADSCVNWSATGYRLPTEAEWEYAARLKADGSLSDGNKPAGCGSADTSTWDDYAWFGEVQEPGVSKPTHAVGQLLPTEYGLHDMSGNVWEICWDWSKPYTTTSPYTDPNTHGPASAGGPLTTDAWKVMRGGAIYADLNYTNNIAVCNRHSTNFFEAWSDVGFRIVRNQ